MNQGIDVLSNQFKDVSDVLAALGNRMRQYIILEMLENGDCRDLRVGTIMQMAKLSRLTSSKKGWDGQDAQRGN